MITQLALYKLLFMAELLLAEFLFTFRLRRREHYALRIGGGYALSFVLAFFCPIFDYSAWYASGMFFLLFGITLGIHFFVYKEPFLNIVFCCIAAYTLQHFSYEVFNLVLLCTGLNDMSAALGGVSGAIAWEIYGSGAIQLTNAFTVIAYAGSYAVCYWLIFVLFANKIKRYEDLQLKKNYYLILSVIIILVDIIFNAIVVYYSYTKFDLLYYTITTLYNIVCCIISLMLQFAMKNSKTLENELNTISHLLSEKEKQYALSTENINLINLKCHDLKHQIRLWGHNSGVRENSIKEIEDIIDIYDSAVKTGNETLDIIMTEKSLICKNEGIRLTCLIDGSLLDFMKDTDLYSLFGNALDNAIEAVKRIDIVDKRVISLTAKKVNAMLSVVIGNYYEGDISFKDGLPETSKADKNLHGYGLKSIRMIAEKYGGAVTVSAENNIFSVNLLFPRE